jgi:hypothetical protein
LERENKDLKLKVKHLTDKLKEEEKKQPSPRIPPVHTSKERFSSAKKQLEKPSYIIAQQSNAEGSGGLKTTAKFGGGGGSNVDSDFELAFRL